MPTSELHTTTQQHSILTYLQHIAEEKRQLGHLRTAETYRATYLSLRKFAGNADIPISAVDATLLARYEHYLQARGLCPNTTSFYMRRLRAAFNRAVDDGLATDTHPFKHVYTGVARTHKRAVTIDIMHRIRNVTLDDPHDRLARDLFLFSFYTRGMSFVDMAYLRRRDLSDGVLTYRRKKTGQLIVIRWTTQMQQLVGQFGSRHSDYLLPIIRTNRRGSERSQIRHVQQLVNRHLKHVSRLAGVETTLTMYVARHSWASIALQLNIPLSVISEGLGHESERTTRIYLKTLDTSTLDRATQQVIDAI